MEIEIIIAILFQFLMSWGFLSDVFIIISISIFIWEFLSFGVFLLSLIWSLYLKEILIKISFIYYLSSSRKWNRREMPMNEGWTGRMGQEPDRNDNMISGSKFQDS